MTDVTNVTDVIITGCDGRDSSNSFLALEFPIVSVTDVTNVTNVTITGCDGRDRCDSSNSFLALEFPIVS